MTANQNKDAAVSFLKMASSRNVREAYSKFVGPGFKHHNQFFEGSAESPNQYGMFQMKKANPAANQTEQVDEFMDKLDHPFKAEVQMVREIIKNVNRDVTEKIKWKAPTFSYKGEYLVTFNLWEKKRIHLVFHNPMISNVKSTLLEGDYDHRRMAHFSDKNDIQAKKTALEKVLKDLIKLQKEI